jgi:hypothetical protein
MTGMSRVAFMLALCGAMVGFAASIFVPRRYKADARFAFNSAYAANAQAIFEGASEVTLLPQSLELMIRQSPNFKNQLYVEAPGEIVAEVRSAIVLKLSGSKGSIEYEDDNVDTALEVTRVLLSEFGDNAARIANAQKGTDVIRIVRTPEAGLTGLTPWRLTIAGLASGLCLALLIRMLLPRRTNS